MSLKKILICPWFGKFPEWMSKFEAPEGYDCIIDTDLEDFKNRVKMKLGFDYPGVWGDNKLSDYRSALGYLYEDEISGYNFWGHADFDVAWGNLDKFVPDSMLEELDMYSSHNEYVCGCFSLYRNCKEMNELFMQPGWWIDCMDKPETNGWVEKEYSRWLEQSGLRYKYDFPQGYPWTKTPILKKEDKGLFQEINGEWVEVGLYHFRHSKRWPL